jgi:endonuclease/exonuclease/phosphatase family metal-dependent hydrolase
LEKNLAKQRAHFAAEKPAAESLLKVGDFNNPAETAPAELAAWTAVANVILNLNETVTP